MKPPFNTGSWLEPVLKGGIKRAPSTSSSPSQIVRSSRGSRGAQRNTDRLLNSSPSIPPPPPPPPPRPPLSLPCPYVHVRPLAGAVAAAPLHARRLRRRRHPRPLAGANLV